ncbi:RNA polymerase sigma-70 factor (ECF subfamily) [Prauserella shujinwangii]|uniref:RNA polymerase sigma-70 factor (ECF subfamily) n=1 Tax=Prauserella shujinwangii TaxID=1453103 RepID=A0A2T0M3J2_9PSEU|nr:sigma-70 family RNA polymerase sigma factor [Prauserella shujinwangii]PRX51300.1 RNA polymerase sigma-70 factor (ECF subfamily) [Prauserella shujinwangii]
MAALWASREDAADEVLIRSLYAEHGGTLLAYVTRLTGDRAAAEDVVQETLLRAWRRPDALLDGKGSVRGWLLTVARNIVTDRHRARQARPKEVTETPRTPPVQRDHAESVVDSLVVVEALARLRPEHRDVLTELYFRGHTIEEAARHLGVPAGTVKSRSHHALRSLRAMLGAARDRPVAKSV